MQKLKLHEIHQEEIRIEKFYRASSKYQAKMESEKRGALSSRSLGLLNSPGSPESPLRSSKLVEEKKKKPLVLEINIPPPLTVSTSGLFFFYPILFHSLCSKWRIISHNSKY